MKRLALLLALAPFAAFAEPHVAARTLPAGTVIAPEDIMGGADRDAGDVLGLQTRTVIYEGRPIHPTRLSQPYLVNRNQLVTIAYETPLMRIEAEGRALDPGQQDQVIRVLNLSSRSTVSGRVAADGSVIVQRN